MSASTSTAATGSDSSRSSSAKAVDLGAGHRHHVGDGTAGAPATSRHVGGHRADDGDDRGHVGHLPFQLRPGARRVERDGDGAEAHGGQQGDHERRVVAAQDDHPVPAARRGPAGHRGRRRRGRASRRRSWSGWLINAGASTVVEDRCQVHVGPSGLVTTEVAPTPPHGAAAAASSSGRPRPADHDQADDTGHDDRHQQQREGERRGGAHGARLMHRSRGVGRPQGDRRGQALVGPAPAATAGRRGSRPRRQPELVGRRPPHQ